MLFFYVEASSATLPKHYNTIVYYQYQKLSMPNKCWPCYDYIYCMMHVSHWYVGIPVKKIIFQFNINDILQSVSLSYIINPCPDELLQLYFSSFEAGIANAISSFKWRKIILFMKNRQSTKNYFIKIKWDFYWSITSLTPYISGHSRTRVSICFHSLKCKCCMLPIDITD